MRVSDRPRRRADAAVACTPMVSGSEIRRPLLMSEVLPPSTRTHDQSHKLDDHRLLPSVLEVWMVDSEHRWLQVWRRGGEG